MKKVRGVPQKRRSLAPRAPTFTMVIDTELRARLDGHREVNWSEVCREALRRALDKLEAR